MLIYVNDRYALKTIDEAKWVRGGELGYPHVLCRKKIPRIFLASEFFLVIGDMLPILKLPKKLLLQFFLQFAHFYVKWLGLVVDGESYRPTLH